MNIIRRVFVKIVHCMHKCLSDEKYLRLLFRVQMGYPLNLNNPKSFNEKIQWLKLYDRKPLYTALVDKIEVKRYVASIIGEEHIIKTLATWNNINDIDISKLPNKFVLKCNNGAGNNGVVICKDKSTFDLNAAKKRLEKGMRRDGWMFLKEWPYKNVNRRFFAEEYVESENEALRDYKLLVYNGRVQNLFVVFERETNRNPYINFYDREWNFLPFERDHPNYNKSIASPKYLKEMITLAEQLAKDIPFVRVDFYCNFDKILFGEMTFYPGSGFESFQPIEWDYKLGDLIKLPSHTNGKADD